MNSDLPSWTTPPPPHTTEPHCSMCNRLITDMKEARVLMTVNGSRTPSDMRFVCGQQCLVHARGQRG